MNKPELINYEGLIDNLPLGFAYHHALYDEFNKPIDYIFLETNAKFEELTGLSRDMILGKKVTDVLPGIENEEESLIEIYGDVALTGKAKKFETYVETMHRWYEITVFSPLREHFVTLFSDITEKKLSQEKILKQNEELKEFTHIMNHDLRNILTYLHFNLELLRTDYRIDTMDAIESHLMYIQEILEKSSELALAGEIIDSKIPFSLNGLIKDIADTIIPNNIQFSFDNFPIINGSKAKIYQVLKNILENAVKHGKPTKISVKKEKINTGLNIHFYNDGYPIKQEIIDLFKQDDVYNESLDSLGVKIIKKIIAGHAWNVYANNSPEGPSVTIFIPNIDLRK